MPKGCKKTLTSLIKTMEAKKIIEELKSLGNHDNVAGMARFGIRPRAKVFGVPVPKIRKMARQIKSDLPARKAHKMAQELFDSNIHEAKLLASMIADAEKLSEKEINKWIKFFDSWDIVDQTCMNLFDKSKLAIKKIPEFAKKEPEFEKRAAFALMAALAFHDLPRGKAGKKMKDMDFKKFFPIIKKAASDERNFVKKAVNWALRQIGKRNKNLNKLALELAKEMQTMDSKSAKWIAGDAIKELVSKNVKKKLNK